MIMYTGHFFFLGITSAIIFFKLFEKIQKQLLYNNWNYSS